MLVRQLTLICARPLRNVQNIRPMEITAEVIKKIFLVMDQASLMLPPGVDISLHLPLELMYCRYECVQMSPPQQFVSVELPTYSP